MKPITLDYQGLSIHATREAWFNATEIAAMFDKQPNEWLRLPDTGRYIEALMKREAEKQIISNTGKSRITKTDFIKTKRGNNGGTWLHPKLAVAFARWCDIDFALWCDEQIENLIAGGKDWRTARAESKLGFQVMAEILQAKRQAEGKATKHYHFSNEALLCNAALTGQFRPIERDKLNKAALTMLIRLEARNSALIGQGLPYEKRKAQLFAMAAPHRDTFFLNFAN
ncbi:DNA-binding protein [Neisseria dumasiana]|uniref:DNA-binding protein n=2 Tax=Neisseria dumasiana TaxID=1931275 RepID=A0ABX3WKR1_9NEIS|nr:DNA-binding protein [Neisseria dumasiana]